MSGLTKEDSARIGFATACLFAQALSVSELHEWIVRVLENENETPRYLPELLEFNGPLFKIYKVIGFVPPWPGTDEEKLALYGVSYKRGRVPFDCPLSREEALAKLERYPRIEATFAAMFPFAGTGAGS